MSIPQRVSDYLNDQHIKYDVVHHTFSEGAIQTAIAAKVPIFKMSKAVVLEDHESRHLMAVIPASHKLDIKKTEKFVERSLKFTREKDVFQLFSDCARGAVPAIGLAYYMETLVDERLSRFDEIYLEAGDHEDLLHLTRDEFDRLMVGSRYGNFSAEMATDFEHREGGAIIY